MTKKHTIIAAVIVFGISAVLAQDLWSQSNLKKVPFENLGSIGVLVEDMGAEGRKAGVSKDELKAFIELKLRQNGIRVREMSDFTAESPFIYININLLDLDEVEHFAFSANIGLNQTVRLIRNDQTLCAETWNKGNIAICRRESVRGKIKETVEALLTFFINDYLAANQRSQR